MQWRLITDDAVSASFGLAADDAIATRVGAGSSPTTLRLYTYRSHCALVGRFQRVENEIHSEFCQAHGISINRRPTGGGAIIMGGDQLGIALMIPGQATDVYGRARALMETFSSGLVFALNRLDIHAQFRRKNDVEVKGRKIAGLGLYRTPTGGLLFHGSLLVDLNIPLMLNVLKTPFEKISDKEIATVVSRATTVRRETSQALSLQEVRALVAQGFATTFNVELVPALFSPEEMQSITALEQTRYLRDEWVYQTTDVKESTGAARVKTPGGLLEVRVRLAGQMIQAVSVTGDFFVDEGALADLEASLRWHSCRREALAATLTSTYDRHTGLTAIPADVLLNAICEAVENSFTDQLRDGVQPYGCFINPERIHA